MKTRIISPTHVRKDKRGLFIEILNGKVFKNLAYGSMRKGAILGNHYHKKTSVFFFLLSGSAKVKNFHVDTKASESLLLEANQGLVFKPYVAHALLFTSDSTYIHAKSIKYNDSEPDFYHYRVI